MALAKPFSIHPTMVAQWLKLHAGPAIASILVAASILYVLDRRAPMVMGAPQIEQATVAPGQSVVINWSQTWDRLCPGEVSRTLVTDHGEVKTFRKFDIKPPARIGTIDRQSKLYVPHATPPGTATIQSAIAFRCNFLQEFWPIVVKAPPITIQVVSTSG